MGDLERYLQVLAAADPEGRFLELRYRRAGGMGQQFVPAVDVAAAARIARRLGGKSDTYVGVALRDRPAGGRSAVTGSRVVFVEVDAQAARRLLDRAPRPPSMTVQSGTPGHLHAYWLLSRPVTGAEVTATNRKLCHRVGGDLACVDEARILRPPETLNFKHEPPRPVVLESLHRQGTAITDAQATAGHTELSGELAQVVEIAGLSNARPVIDAVANGPRRAPTARRARAGRQPAVERERGR